jgi:hypothetical protein
MRMKASEGEILECCSHSHHIDVVGTQLVSPRFEVRPHSLILRNAAALGAAFEIRDFISRLQGDLDFRLFPTNDGNDFAVHFDHLEQCIAVWRALQIVPFRGQIIDVEAYAPAVQATNETEFRTSVGTPVIEAVNPAQIVESVIAPDVRIWHSVEVPTKKMREIIVAPARNTRYWHVRP